MKKTVDRCQMAATSDSYDYHLTSIYSLTANTKKIVL